MLATELDNKLMFLKRENELYLLPFIDEYKIRLKKHRDLKWKKRRIIKSPLWRLAIFVRDRLYNRDIEQCSLNFQRDLVLAYRTNRVHSYFFFLLLPSFLVPLFLFNCYFSSSFSFLLALLLLSYTICFSSSPPQFYFFHHHHHLVTATGYFFCHFHVKWLTFFGVSRLTVNPP